MSGGILGTDCAKGQNRWEDGHSTSAGFEAFQVGNGPRISDSNARGGLMGYSCIDESKGSPPVSSVTVICSRRVRLFISHALSGIASGGYRDHSI